MHTDHGSIHPQHPSPKPAPRSQATPFPVLVGGFYVMTILAVAIFGGSQLYAWAYGRTFRGGFAGVPLLLGRQVAPPSVSAGSDRVRGAEPAVVPNSDAGSAAEPDTVPLPTHRINVLLLGVDSRPDETDVPRTDTMMLLTLDPDSRSAGMLSMPRDMWVPIPGYDLTSKINTAYAIGENRHYPGGGDQLAKDTVSGLTGHPVDYYVRMNFDGFVKIIDLIDGIDLVVPKTIHDEYYPTQDYGYQTFHIDVGPQHLNGETALMYARTRNTDDDYSRAGRQQQVIQAVLDKVLRTAMIPTLVARAPQLLSALRDSIATDVPLSMAIGVAQYVGQGSITVVRHLVLDNRYGTETYSDNGMWILLPNREKTRRALAEFFSAPVSPRPGAGIVGTPGSIDESVPPPTDMASVRVEILNGSGYPNIAARTQELLQTRGWDVVAIGNADRMDYRRTLIVNYHTPERLLEQISADLSMQPTVSRLAGLNNQPSIDLRIIIGQDFVKNVLHK